MRPAGAAAAVILAHAACVDHPVMARKHGDKGPKATIPALVSPNTPERMLDRAAGAIVGALVGEALGVGVHWQYDLATLEQDRGWVSDYTTPLPDTYHAGKLVAGQTTLPGTINTQLLESLATRGALDQADFHSRVDEVLRSSGIDGTRGGGRWGWTDKVICELYRSRVVENRPWAECAAPRSDTTDTIVRAALLAGRYHGAPGTLCELATAHAAAQTLDEGVIANSAAFACLVGGAIQGVPLQQLSDILYQQADDGVLPFSILKGHRDTEGVPEPDGLLWFGAVMKGAGPGGIGASIEPAHKGVTLYGQFCAYFACLPSACESLFITILCCILRPL